VEVSRAGEDCAAARSAYARAFAALEPRDLRETGMRRHVGIALVVLGMLCGTAFAGDPTGTWLSQSGETKVRIAPCGGEFCGTIVWTKGGGKDEKNPDPALRGRALAGVQMIFGMKPSGSGYAGRLYNYADGKTYSGKLKTVGDDKLQLSGCVMGVFCKRQTWTRAE
jgi:uncharacterized protein (DUF2147 family)